MISRYCVASRHHRGAYNGGAVGETSSIRRHAVHPAPAGGFLPGRGFSRAAGLTGARYAGCFAFVLVGRKRREERTMNRRSLLAGLVGLAMIPVAAIGAMARRRNRRVYHFPG